MAILLAVGSVTPTGERSFEEVFLRKRHKDDRCDAAVGDPWFFDGRARW
jgi:hypothetical protein